MSERRRPVTRGDTRHQFVVGRGAFDIRGRVLILCAECDRPKNAPRHRDLSRTGDPPDIIGQAVHDLTTSINHRLAHPVGLDEDCRVLGRVIASRINKAGFAYRLAANEASDSPEKQ